MDFGIALASNLDAWKTVKRAEELGFSHAWFYDTQMLVPDILVTMALAADKTSKIKLGMGVMVPTNRIAPVAANALASLNKLAPGRIFSASARASRLATRWASARCACPSSRVLACGTRPAGGRDSRVGNRGRAPQDSISESRGGDDQHKRSHTAPYLGVRAKARKLTAAIADGWMTFSAGSARARCRRAGEIVPVVVRRESLPHCVCSRMRAGRGRICRQPARKGAGGSHVGGVPARSGRSEPGPAAVT